MSDDLAKQLRTDAEAYRQSLAAPTSYDIFSLAYQWQDKKHRHVWDLCKKIEVAAGRIEKLEADLEVATMKRLLDSDRIEMLEAALRTVKEWHGYGLPPETTCMIDAALEGKDD